MENSDKLEKFKIAQLWKSSFNTFKCSFNLGILCVRQWILTGRHEER